MRTALRVRAGAASSARRASFQVDGVACHVARNRALLADWQRRAPDADFDLGGSADVDIDAFSVGVRWNIR